MKLSLLWAVKKKVSVVNDFDFHVGRVDALDSSLPFAIWFNVVKIVVDEDITFVSQFVFPSKLSVQHCTKFFQICLNVDLDVSESLEHITTGWGDQVDVKLTILAAW